MPGALTDHAAFHDDPDDGRQVVAAAPQEAPRGGPWRWGSAGMEMSAGLLKLMRQMPCTLEVVERPETFAWTDGIDGLRWRHRPLAFVRRADGHHAFVDAMPRADLRHDPNLGGLRKRIQLECLARGACYEVWTEDEVKEDQTGALLVRVADARQRIAYKEAAAGSGVASMPVVLAVAQRLSLGDVRKTASGCVAMSNLTGILMAFAWDVDVDPRTRMAVWRPRKPEPRLAAEPTAASALANPTDGTGNR